jgi:EAL domain-containing protein (putative c-di-GMP-specific phosphodiesterase class I)
MNTPERDTGLVKTIAAMANSLNLSVAAEGLETEEELKILMNFSMTRFRGIFQLTATCAWC